MTESMIPKNSEFKIMGILNTTPDSFSDGFWFYSRTDAVSHGIMLLDDGADFIDIGGESTRPGADIVSEEEELRRVIPVIEELKKARPNSIISIDTRKYEVARSALDAGASMINDVSGLMNDTRLAELASYYNATLIIMHMQGQPGSMQKNPVYEDVVSEVYSFLEDKVNLARSFGVKNIIIDVGIGFGKTLEHNLELLRNLSKFKEIGAPVLLGISRKSFLGQILGIENPQERDLATFLFHALLQYQMSVDIIRVHEVKSAVILKKLNNAFFK